MSAACRSPSWSSLARCGAQEKRPCFEIKTPSWKLQACKPDTGKLPFSVTEPSQHAKCWFDVAEWHCAQAALEASHGVELSCSADSLVAPCRRRGRQPGANDVAWKHLLTPGGTRLHGGQELLVRLCCCNSTVHICRAFRVLRFMWLVNSKVSRQAHQGGRLALPDAADNKWSVGREPASTSDPRAAGGSPAHCPTP